MPWKELSPIGGAERIISGPPLDHVVMGKRRGGDLEILGNQGPPGDGPGVWVAKFNSAPH